MTNSVPDLSERHFDKQLPGNISLARWLKSEIVWGSLLLALTVCLAVFRLEGSPQLGFDESYYLQLAKNLVLHGEYALTSPPQEEDWFGLGNSSPTLVLPIALIFKVAGIGVTQARLIAALYMIAAVMAAYMLLRYLYGWPVAALGTALFLIAGPTSASLFTGGNLIGIFNTIWTGRKVLGEVPGLFFLLLGIWAWFQAWDRNRIGWLIGAGLLFGLAFVTKEQFLPIVVPAWGLMWLADRFYYRSLKFQHFLVPYALGLAVLAIWYGCKFVVLGPEAFGRHLATLSQVSRVSTWLFEPGSWTGHLSFLYNNAFHLVGLSGILYTFALSSRRDLTGLKSLFLPVLATGFVLWFAFLSIGWARYAYTGLALAGLLAAKPLGDLLAGLPLTPAELWANLRQGRNIWQPVVAVVALLMIGYPLQDISRQIFFEADLSPQEFAAYVTANTEPDALIESFEWQIDFLTDRQFHHPPAEVFVQLLKNRPDPTYDPLAFGPRYLINGPYAKGSQLYAPGWLDQCCRKMGGVGNFELYEVK